MQRERTWRSGYSVQRVLPMVMMVGFVAMHVSSRPAGATAGGEIRIVSLGDSFIAGTGVGNYYDDQGPGPAPGPRVPGDGRNCYQSYSSYPWQYTQMLNDSGTPAAIWHVACHGAHTGDVIPQWNTVPADWRQDADVILISAGGNDANFSSIAENCLLNRPGGQTCDAALAYAESQLDEVIGRLEAIVETIARENHRARIVFVGYPYLASPAYEKCTLGRGQAELTALQSEHDLALVGLASRLNADVAPRFSSVLVSGRFLGRGPCDFQAPLLHHLSLTEGHSFHPNFDGARMYAEVLFDSGVHDRVPSADARELMVLPSTCVVYDSAAAGDSPFAGEERRRITVAGGDGSCIPAHATAALLNVAAVDPLTEGNLRVAPAGETVSGGAGVVNYGANALDNSNTVLVPLADGAIDVEANAGFGSQMPTTHVRVIAMGYQFDRVGPAAGFVPVNPCAIADSRPSKGADDAFDGPADDGYWPSGSTLPMVDVVGEFDAGQGGLNGVGNTNDRPVSCGVPADATGVLLNVVAANPSGGAGTIAAGQPGVPANNRPSTPFATLDPGLSNGAVAAVPLLDDGQIAVGVLGDVGARTIVRVEVLGYFAHEDEAAAFSPVVPCTAFDSRPNKGATGEFAGYRRNGPDHATTYQVSGLIPVGQGKVEPIGDSAFGNCAVHEGATAVLMNFEAVNALREGNLWVSAADTTSTGGILNFNALDPKMNNANAVVVPLDSDGRIRVEVNAGSHVEPGTEIVHTRGIVLGFFS